MIDAEIDLAAKVHYSFLPGAFSNGFADIHVLAKPKDKLGGDYCSILPIDAHRLLLSESDVNGHGFASALYAARINTFVLSRATQSPDPCTLITKLNEFLVDRLANTRMYASFSSALIDFKKMEIKCASAGHPPIMHYSRPKGEAQLLMTKAPFLGFQHPLPINCAVKANNIDQGDKIIMFTDGITEAKNDRGELFGLGRLCAITNKHFDLDSASFNQLLFDKVNAFTNNQQDDDILVMTLSVK